MPIDRLDVAASREGNAHANRMVSIGDPRRPKPRRRGIRCGNKRHSPPPPNVVRPTLEQILGFGDQRDARPIANIEKIITLYPE
jgi:hypothetical protein